MGSKEFLEKNIGCGFFKYLVIMFSCVQQRNIILPFMAYLTLKTKIIILIYKVTKIYFKTILIVLYVSCLYCFRKKSAISIILLIYLKQYNVWEAQFSLITFRFQSRGSSNFEFTAVHMTVVKSGSDYSARCPGGAESSLWGLKVIALDIKRIFHCKITTYYVPRFKIRFISQAEGTPNTRGQQKQNKVTLCFKQHAQHARFIWTCVLLCELYDTFSTKLYQYAIQMMFFIDNLKKKYVSLKQINILE